MNVDYIQYDVLVISDTHVESAAVLPSSLFLLAQKADLIVHAGDFVARDVIDVLSTFARLEGVLGNCDHPGELAALDVVNTFSFGGLTFSVTHDPGPEVGREQRLLDRFDSSDVIIYGHTHSPVQRKVNGVWMINPGSAVQRRSAPFCSAVMMRISNAKVISCELINLDE